MLILKYLNWEKCSFLEYHDIAFKYGFNAESSPYLIDFAIKNGANLEFFLFKHKGHISGGCCVDNGWLCNDIKNPKSQTSAIPMPHYSIMLPFQHGISCLVPFKSKHVSRKNLFLNSSFDFFSKRNIAISKLSSEFSNKTISTRNRESRKFIEEGGSFHKSLDFQSDELYSIYCELFSKRRPGKSADSKIGMDFFRAFSSSFIGDVAMVNDVPVAFQLNLVTRSNYGMFVDFINIAYDPAVKKHSLGTIMMWHNLKIIERHALECNSELTYSYGMMSGDYKHRWCNAERVGRLISF
ncbi:antimicrobial resistance protein Mig-14 [Klebsiella pneumoniae]|uniref:antimicrobial resistance protein Mig-14 n=1 Tax=Klebsiella pneumoniae TaxID=573 RepID=UPI001FAC6E5A|nr:antimicrobial resistance protein Mig-14 [Klebsiella pneumoniae]MCI8067524.1 transcriptional regulator [Klebsiella pneumoniae]